VKFEGKKRDLILLVPCTLIVADVRLPAKKNLANFGYFIRGLYMEIPSSCPKNRTAVRFDS